MKTRINYYFLIILLFIVACSTTQISEKNSTFQYFNPDTVQSFKFDTGKMWTLEDAPLEYFEEKYSFKPSEEWMNKIQKSALKFGSWCSASFVSGDGLILTNHHCVDFITSRIEEEGEEINENGFYAPTLEDERKVPNLSVDQLLLIEDVTNEVFSAIDSVKDQENREKVRAEKIAEIEKAYSEKTDLICNVTSLYQGGKYSLYGYKRYTDVRAVYVNETNMGLYGGDPDNFTYPRYNPDFAFFRVYDDEGNPLQTENYFEWSLEGAQEDEPIFVVGHPGSTYRLKTMSQLEFMRDFSSRNSAFLSKGKTDIYYDLIKIDTANAKIYESRMVYIGNSAKVFCGMYDFLTDEYLMARKRDFENKFKSAVLNDPELKGKYGHLWDALESVVAEKNEYAGRLSAYTISSRSNSKYFSIAQDMVKLARELNKAENERRPDYKTAKIDQTIKSIFPEDFNYLLEEKYLELNIEYFYLNLGVNNSWLKQMFNGLRGEATAQYAIKSSSISSPEKIKKLAESGGEAILNSPDPFITYILKSEEVLASISTQSNENKETEKMLENELGKALFEVYGTTIPPDATFTLRISDGELKSYNYNGTIAPTHTTFYGMYDRYYSHNQKYPWDLPERWQNPKEGFKMSTQYNFISTNDVTGGSSGSPVLNAEAKIIGTSFDGNIESIPGDFIYNPVNNRSVSVSSAAILQILKYIACADRIVDELKNGMISE